MFIDTTGYGKTEHLQEIHNKNYDKIETMSREMGNEISLYKNISAAVADAGGADHCVWHQKDKFTNLKMVVTCYHHGLDHWNTAVKLFFGLYLAVNKSVGLKITDFHEKLVAQIGGEWVGGHKTTGHHVEFGFWLKNTVNSYNPCRWFAFSHTSREYFAAESAYILPYTVHQLAGYLDEHGQTNKLDRKNIRRMQQSIRVKSNAICLLFWQLCWDNLYTSVRPFVVDTSNSYKASVAFLNFMQWISKLIKVPKPGIPHNRLPNSFDELIDVFFWKGAGWFYSKKICTQYIKDDAEKKIRTKQLELRQTLATCIKNKNVKGLVGVIEKYINTEITYWEGDLCDRFGIVIKHLYLYYQYSVSDLVGQIQELPKLFLQLLPYLKKKITNTTKFIKSSLDEVESNKSLLVAIPPSTVFPESGNKICHKQYHYHKTKEALRIYNLAVSRDHRNIKTSAQEDKIIERMNNSTSYRKYNNDNKTANLQLVAKTIEYKKSQKEPEKKDNAEFMPDLNITEAINEISSVSSKAARYDILKKIKKHIKYDILAGTATDEQKELLIIRGMYGNSSNKFETKSEEDAWNDICDLLESIDADEYESIINMEWNEVMDL